MARKLFGRVVSDKMDKTVVVIVERLKTHPIYKKQYRQTKKIKAHDENNSFKIGDEVEITEVNPISKDKKFVVVSKLQNKKVKP